ncbi:lysosomal acid phosphatase-like protein 3 [Leptotrombidium deliense]|uniref:acid phosphatase n=1 Tax=Leptotrombidium deliense TaxID=299467 RepID=A0A443SRH8_9ACAR|nr:lysosomal acid phosphatase-like protein 3 [Leptotrombidium deliense]
MKIDDLQTVAKLQDILEIQQKKGWKLPDWVTDTLLKEMKTIADKTLTFDCSTKLMQKFRSGVLMKKINEILDQNENYEEINDLSSDDFQKKIFLFTTVIAALLSALDVFNNIKPPFGATIFIELNSQNKIRLLYMNLTEFETPITLQLHDCDYEDVCDLATFMKSMQRVIPRDWKQECGYLNIENCNDSGYQIYATVVIVIGLIAIVAAMFVIIREREKRKTVTED